MELLKSIIGAVFWAIIIVAFFRELRIVLKIMNDTYR